MRSLSCASSRRSPPFATECNDMNDTSPVAIRPRRNLDRVAVIGTQRGAALAVSIILLVVVALLGLTAMRGTIMQQKMASNAHARELAFQSAEAAMRVAAALLPTSPTLIARNCQTSGTVCRGNPFTDPNLPAGSI